MDKKMFEIEVKEGGLDYLEALFYEYKAKQDIITSIFDLHKFDDDTTLINSAPFKAYEKEFIEIKIQYEKALEEIKSMYIPREQQDAGCRFEVDFDNGLIKVYPL